jgi:hypothetical protein
MQFGGEFMIKKCFDWNTDGFFNAVTMKASLMIPLTASEFSRSAFVAVILPRNWLRGRFSCAEPRRAAFAEVAMFATIGYILPEYWRLMHLSSRKMEKFRWVSGWWLQVLFGCCKCHTYAVGKIMCICIMYRIVDNNREDVIIIVILIVITITMIATLMVIHNHTY